MSKESVIVDCKKIDTVAASIGNEESLIRLLCSSLYYNEVKNTVNPDAFDLRILKSGDYESFVSLIRVACLMNQEDLDTYLAEKGYRIWDNNKNVEEKYYGYGTFNCGDAREVHNMIEINPLTDKNKAHVGLFYKHPKGGYYNGPLPKENAEILEVLSDLADLLTIKKAPARLIDIK